MQRKALRRRFPLSSSVFRQDNNLVSCYSGCPGTECFISGSRVGGGVSSFLWQLKSGWSERAAVEPLNSWENSAVPAEIRSHNRTQRPHTSKVRAHVLPVSWSIQSPKQSQAAPRKQNKWNVHAAVQRSVSAHYVQNTLLRSTAYSYRWDQMDPTPGGF